MDNQKFNEIKSILLRLEHLCFTENKDLICLKKNLLSASKDEIEFCLNQLDLNNIVCVFEKLLNSNVNFVFEEISDIFFYLEKTLDIFCYYEKFEKIIFDELKKEKSKIKIIFLKSVKNCLKDEQAFEKIIKKLDIIILNIGDENENVAKQSIEIIKTLVSMNEMYLEKYINKKELIDNFILVKNNNEIKKFRYYELMIDLVIIREENLNILFVKDAIQSLYSECCSDDPIIIRNSLVLINKLIEKKIAIKQLDNFGYFNLINSKIINIENDCFQNLLMPGYLETITTIGLSIPETLNFFHQSLEKIMNFVIDDNIDFNCHCIETIGLIGKSQNGKIFLNSINLFLNNFLPKLGNIIESNKNIKADTLVCLINLFEMNEFESNEQISNLLNDWYQKLSLINSKIAETIFILCKQIFPEYHLNALNLIRVLCIHSWGQKEFAKLNTFVDYLIDRKTESDYISKKTKYKLITELVNSPFTSSNFGGLNFAKIRKYYQEGEFHINRDLNIMTERQ